MRQRLLIGLIVTVGMAFLLGLAASRGVFGSHGWAVALIVGAAICAAIAVALAPLDPRAHLHRLADREPQGQGRRRHPMRQRLLIGLIVTVGMAFLLGLAASHGVFGSHGWAVALIVGAAICAAIAVALAPLDHRAHLHRPHPLRR